MIADNNIWMVMAGLVPLFTSLTWLFLLLLGLRDSKTIVEREVRMSFLYYLIVFTVGYSLLTLYTYRPEICTNFAPLVTGAFLLTPVLFYRLTWLLTDGGRNEPFAYLKHLSVAVLLTLLLSVWFPFIPSSVQSDLIAGREVGADYNLLHWSFRLRPFVQLLFILIYVYLSLRRLIKQMRIIHPAENSSKRSSRQMLYAIIVSFLVPTVSSLLLLMPQQKLLSNPLPIALILFFVVLHSLLGYGIIRGDSIAHKFPFIQTEDAKATKMPIITPKKVMRRIAERVENAEGKMVVVPLTIKRFEEYINEQKPYLNADIKITDFIEPLKANRSIISNFVNKNYGLNFNQYINQLRIKELKQLKKLPSNADKAIVQLLPKVGFSSMRNYKRAVVALNDNQTSKNQ